MTQPGDEVVIRASSKEEAIAQALDMGRNYHTQGDLHRAAACYRGILDLVPDHADGLFLLGTLAFQAGDIPQSIALLERAVRQNPNDAGFVNLGVAYRKGDKIAEAQAAYEKAITLNPTSFDAHYNLGKLFLDSKSYDRAIESYGTCLALDDKNADAHINLGNAYKYSGAPDEAMKAYARAAVLAPQNPVIYGNMAAVMLDRGAVDEALAFLDKAVEADPRPSELRLRRGIKLLQRGQLAKGWPDYESRFSTTRKRIPRHVTPMAWAGEDLSEKTILLWSDQGLGDEIIYAQMIPDVVRRAKRCIVECSARMAPVFARSFPDATVAPHRADGEIIQPSEGIDVQSAVASLGQFLRTDFGQFPTEPGYLKANPGRTVALRARYRDVAPGNLIVGIAWHSSTDATGAVKTTALAMWKYILTVPGVTFVNLQYGDHADEIAAARSATGARIIEDAEIDSLKNMDDFFAQVAAMDMVITTSNTAVHVAGALGVPTWLLLSASPLWYWFMERGDSPWYPTVTLFRDPPSAPQRWMEAIARIGAALTRRVKERPPGRGPA